MTAYSGERIESIDVLRGVAVLGILLMNIVSMGLPFAAYDDPTIIGNRGPIDYWTWAVATVLVEGKMRAIFSMLFGAGVVLMAERAEARGESSARLHVRRNLWLVLIGAAHAYLLLWPGDILFTYAVAGLPLFALRRLRPRTLLILAGLVLALQLPRIVTTNRELAEASGGLRDLARLTEAGEVLTPEQETWRQRWHNRISQEKPTPEMLRATVDQRQRGYLSNLSAAAPSTLYIETTYLYQVGLWDAVAMMLAGMALLKLGVFSASRSFRLYALMAAVGYGVGMPIAVWEVADWTRQGFEPGLRWASLHDTTRVAIATGHIAVVMALCKAGVFGRLTRLLAAAGRMALTNYILQTAIGMTLVCGFGFGWYGRLARHELYYVVGAIWVVQLLGSAAWLGRYRFGPLEWVWRSLTYGRRQAMMRGGPGDGGITTGAA